MNNQSTEQHWQVLVLLLKNIAAEKGITREQISDKTGMKASSISRIFSLRYRVTLANYVSIAQAIGVNLFIDDKDSKAVEDAEEALGKEQEQGDMTEDEFDNKTECLFNKPTTEQPSIELSKLSKLDLKQMLLEIFEHRMGDFTIDHYVTLIFYSLTNTK